jgi:hypothetical protein
LCIIPFGIKIAIFIRLILFTFHVFEFGIEYLLTSGTPSNGYFATILNPSGSVGNNTATGPGGNLPPSGGGANVPLAGDTTNSTPNNYNLSPIIKYKVELQKEESKRLFTAVRSIYDTTNFTPEATLTKAECTELGIAVQRDEINGTSGVYSAVHKKNIDELRVVRRPARTVLESSLQYTTATKSFIDYLGKLSGDT